MSGAPIGNKNATKGAVARQALIKAIELKSLGEEFQGIDRMKCLIDIWAKQIDQALDGDNGSAAMIVDRLDGRPKQAIIGGDEDDEPIRITRIELIPLANNSAD